jgi:CII-binding regulator of phage lambda lysogenization HflD
MFQTGWHSKLNMANILLARQRFHPGAPAMLKEAVAMMLLPRKVAASTSLVQAISTYIKQIDHCDSYISMGCQQQLHLL